MPQFNTFERTFAGARSTFQRLSDAKILLGWTERMEGYGVVIRANLQTPLYPGDRFLFRLSGRGGDAMFTARLSSVESEDAAALVALAAASGTGAFLDLAEQYYTFNIEGSVQMVKAETEARYSRENGSVVLDGWLEGQIKDVSEHGLGILTQEEIPSKSTVKATIYAGMGVIEVNAEVRYCRKVSDNPATYRVGLRLADLDRINTSRWNAVLQRAA